MIAWGRETCGDLAAAESRDWLCTNGIGGFASGTVAGLLTRRDHGWLIAAFAPPLGRRLLVAALDEVVHRFRLDGSVPEWTFACGDALVTRQLWKGSRGPTPRTCATTCRGAPARSTSSCARS